MKLIKLDKGVLFMELIEPYDCCCPRLAYACGEYFIDCELYNDICFINCPSCFHSFKELTIKEWNDWAIKQNNK